MPSAKHIACLAVLATAFVSAASNAAPRSPSEAPVDPQIEHHCAHIAEAERRTKRPRDAIDDVAGWLFGGQHDAEAAAVRSAEEIGRVFRSRLAQHRFGHLFSMEWESGALNIVISSSELFEEGSVVLRHAADDTLRLVATLARSMCRASLRLRSEPASGEKTSRAVRLPIDRARLVTAILLTGGVERTRVSIQRDTQEVQQIQRLSAAKEVTSNADSLPTSD